MPNNENVAGQEIDQPVDTQVDQQPEQAQPEQQEVGALETPKMVEFLDSISEPDPNADAKPEAKPEEPVKADGEQPVENKLPQTPEQEEAELLDMIKSDRGRDRVKSIIEDKKALAAENDGIKDIIRSTNMNAEEFSSTIEYCRLVGSGDENNLRVALNMVEQQRESICKRLGIAAPGVDPLSDFPQLKNAVDNFEITPEHALQLAKLQRQEAANKQSMQAQQAQQQDSQQFQHDIQQAAQTAQAYMQTRAGETDYPIKEKAIIEYFKNPQNRQNFVQNFEPRQWLTQFKFMYDNISVPRQQHAPQPIRSRPIASGSSASNPNASTSDKLMGFLDTMGI